MHIDPLGLSSILVPPIRSILATVSFDLGGFGSIRNRLDVLRGTLESARHWHKRLDCLYLPTDLLRPMCDGSVNPWYPGGSTRDGVGCSPIYAMRPGSLSSVVLEYARPKLSRAQKNNIRESATSSNLCDVLSSPMLTGFSLWISCMELMGGVTQVTTELIDELARRNRPLSTIQIADQYLKEYFLPAELANVCGDLTYRSVEFRDIDQSNHDRLGEYVDFLWPEKPLDAGILYTLAEQLGRSNE